jgi:hypothetical protein
MPWKTQIPYNGIRRKTAYYLGGLAIRVLSLYVYLISTVTNADAAPRVLPVLWTQVNGQRQAQEAPPPVHTQQEAAWPQSQSGHAGVEKNILPWQESCWTEVESVYWAVRNDSLYKHILLSLKAKTFATWNRLHVFISIKTKSWYIRIHATVTNYTLPRNFI